MIASSKVLLPAWSLLVVAGKWQKPIKSLCIVTNQRIENPGAGARIKTACQDPLYSLVKPSRLILVHVCSPGDRIAARRLRFAAKLPPTFNTILPAIQGWDRGTLLTFSTYSLLLSRSTIFQIAEVETPSCLAVSARDKANSIESTTSPSWFGNQFHENPSMIAFGLMVLRSGGRVKMDCSALTARAIRPARHHPGVALEMLTDGKYNDEWRVRQVHLH